MFCHEIGSSNEIQFHLRSMLAELTGWPAGYLPEASACASTSVMFCKFLG